MRLYNTLSRRIEEADFPGGVVRMYVCGITPYDTSHLGHARVGVVYDTLRRYLQHQGLRVRYVQNVTDIDEPLFERARRDGVRWQDLGEQQTQRYLASLQQLNIEQPEFYVRATSVIPQMIPIITLLINQGHAYVRNGSVYYHAASKEHFGEIAHTDYQTMLALANEMGNNPNDSNKLDPLDFLLWQPSQPDEPAWDSPWGPGRPGWHIECSTMATEYLGPQIDIHGGGTDLIFPHHACEIAQAEAATGVTPFVRYWMHTGMVALHGTKMSKSLGNMVFVDDVLAMYSPAALRLAILSYPYRAEFEYSEQTVERAEAIVTTMRRALAAANGGSSVFNGEPYRQRFFAALAEDFDTPAAIKVVDELAQAIVSAATGQDVHPAQRVLLEIGIVLGVQLEPEQENYRNVA
jgi:L-cysteine:1D-myo-inositol 2-amino-2-deoxy-alpha-D-glucopyranoside ligase